MDFAEALRRRIPLQVRLPDPTQPLEPRVRYAAEVFLVETVQGPAVVWLDPFWYDKTPEAACHIAYARPDGDSGPGRWVDNEPRYGPRCSVCQKPFLMEHLERGSPAWPDFKAWQLWREGKADRCGRKAAWKRVAEVFGGLIIERRV